MIFQRNASKNQTSSVAETFDAFLPPSQSSDEVETVVGPSVNVEGDFASEGNIVVKGTVAGSVYTSRHLLVEQGARIMANVRAGSAKISGEVRGNLKIKDALELTATAKVLGDIEAKILVIEAGALLCGKVLMPGIDGAETKANGKQNKSLAAKKIEENSDLMPL